MSQSTEKSNPPASIPAESRLNTTWDTCIEQAIIKTGYGLAIGGLSAFVLFRSPTSRSLIAGLGAGFGAGLSYNDCKGLLCQRGLSTSKKCPVSSRSPAVESPKDVPGPESK